MYRGSQVCHVWHVNHHGYTTDQADPGMSSDPDIRVEHELLRLFLIMLGGILHM